MTALAPIGLDIGSTSIRAVEATRTKERPVIHQFGQALLPEGAVVGGVVKDHHAVTAALRHLWAAQNFRTKDVILGVTHQQVVVRQVEVSNLPAKEMRQALPFQVRDVLPLPVEAAVLDFFPLERPGDKDTVRVWDVQTGEQVGKDITGGYLAAFLPDGQVLTGAWENSRFPIASQ